MRSSGRPVARSELEEIKMTFAPASVPSEPALVIGSRVAGHEQARLVRKLADGIQALQVRERQAQLRNLTRAASWS